jgi:ribosome biogenesis protein SSF1/2
MLMIVQKTPEEAAKIKAKMDMQKALKRKRREEQEARVKEKREADEAKKAATPSRYRKDMAAQRQALQQYANKSERRPYQASGENPMEDVEDMDDADYYRQEVGEEPDAYMFTKKSTRQHHKDPHDMRKTTKMQGPKRRKHTKGPEGM